MGSRYFAAGRYTPSTTNKESSPPALPTAIGSISMPKIDWLEDGSQVWYKGVPGPTTYVDIDGQPLAVGHVRIDEFGQRFELQDEKSWSPIDSLVQVQTNENGSYSRVDLPIALNPDKEWLPDAWLPVGLPPVNLNDPTLLWQGL
ncbi:hypothetical protein PG994_005682 [Apiospora phragmitis]|uniref:Uncharacterized protein n=1 Tax=Apiospora phragmitis TaxID=2905665 RepID=A0ABR1VFH8_9PEZI